MIKFILLPLLLCYTVFCNAQGPFKKITIHKTDGSEFKCYVKNFRFDRKPEQLFYLLNHGGKTRAFLLDSITKIKHRKKEYIIADVEFDNTTNDIGKLDKLGEKSWNNFFFLKEETLYLQILVKGEITLYKSYLNGVAKFFIKNKEGVIIPLLYKKYFIPRPLDYIGPNFSKENNFYQQQLINEAPCLDKHGEWSFPKYSEFGLINYFNRINEGRCW